MEREYVEDFDELNGRRQSHSGGSDIAVEVCFAGRSMGWSWALFVCNDAVTEAMTAACRKIRMCDKVAGNRRMTSHFYWRTATAAPYVDNSNVLSSPQAGLLLHGAVTEKMLRP